MLLVRDICQRNILLDYAQINVHIRISGNRWTHSSSSKPLCDILSRTFFQVQSTFELFVPVDVMFFAKMEWKSQRDLLPSVNSISAVGWSLTVRSNYLVINEPPITSANGRQMAIGGSS